MKSTEKVQPILLIAETGKIEELKNFAKALESMANEVAKKFQRLGFTAPGIDELIEMTEQAGGIESVIKSRMIKAMPETVQIGGATLNKSKTADLLELPDTARLTDACRAMQDLISKFDSAHRNDTKLNQIYWNRCIKFNGSEFETDETYVNGLIEDRLKVYATTERQIDCYNGMREISRILNESIFPNINTEKLVHKRPHSFDEYMVSKDRFFDLFKFNERDKVFEVNVEMIKSIA